MVLLFDFSSMQPAEQIRAKNAAIQFLTAQMTASDSVSLMVFGSTLRTVQDFTSDRDLLIATINKFHIGDSSENASIADTGPRDLKTRAASSRRMKPSSISSTPT